MRRLSLPHLGNLHIPIEALFRELDVDYVVTPPNSQRTMSLGVKYSPEGLCIPFKLTTGNMIEAAELGADTMLMAGGTGICRLGYYAKTQQQILNDLGYKAQVVRLGVSQNKLLGFLHIIKDLSNNAPWTRIISAFRFGLAKLNTVDEIEKLVQEIRAAELHKGAASRIYTRSLEAIDKASDYKTLKNIKKEYIGQLQAVEHSDHIPLTVGITGEFYVLLEPFSNLDIESELGKLGVRVKRTLFISTWTRFSWFLNPLGVDEKEKIHLAAMPYLKRDIGGEGWESVGEKVLHAGKYDGIVHLAPFTCMPEIVAQNIMQSTKENIPVLTVLCDEQLAKPGLMTRLEAFVDLLERRRRVRNEKAALVK